MKTIPLEQLSVYLPYGLKMKAAHPSRRLKDIEILSTMNYYTLVHVLKRKPLLHPLSKFKDINSEAMNNQGVDFDRIWINELANGWAGISIISYGVIQLMAKNHIDMFGLIDKGLAEPIK